MSVRFDASTDLLQRNVSTPAGPEWTVYLRVKVNSAPGSGQFSSLFLFSNSTTNPNPFTGTYAQLYIDQISASTFRFAVDNTAVIHQTAAALNYGLWTDVAFVRRGTDIEVWVNGTLYLTLAGTSAPSAYNIAISDSVYFLDVALHDVLVYDGIAHTGGQILDQCYASAPQELYRLWAWWKLEHANDLFDYSGAGRHLSSAGTLTSETNNPVTYRDVDDDWLVWSSLLVPQATGGNEGQLNKTLDDITLASQAILLLQAQLAKTIDAVTLSSASTLLIQGALSKTIDDVTLSSTGVGAVPIEGQLNVTLANVTLVSAATLALRAELNKTLDSVALAATGQGPVIGGSGSKRHRVSIRWGIGLT